MGIQHDKDDNYMLQVKVKGNWHDVHNVRKSGGANICRTSAKNTGNSHRVINLSKGGAIYCENESR